MACSRRSYLGSIGSVSLGMSIALGGCYGSEESSSTPRPAFSNVATEVGFDVEASAYALPNGLGGVYVNDFNNDERGDVLVTGDDDAILFENTGGEFVRANVLPDLDIVPHVAMFFDHDNSGWEDLLLIPYAGTPVFLANETGQFERREVGLEVSVDVGMGVTGADFFGDGYPDVFVVQNGDWIGETPVRGVDPEAAEDNGNPNLLFRGDGDGFERIEAPSTGEDRWSLATSALDFTGNGWPDIHVANDFNYDVLYKNLGEGTFEAVEIPDTDRHGMSSATADVTGDGQVDIFVTNIHYPDTDVIFDFKGQIDINNDGNNLLSNRGNGEFEDVAEAYGVYDGAWGWAAVLADFTNDTRVDITHATKHYLVQDDQGYERRSPPLRFWQGSEDGFTRIDDRNIGLEPSDGRGLAALDYNRDGKLDLVLGNNNGPFRLYENRSEDRNWLQVDVRGDGTHTAIGATVSVTADGETQFQVRDAKTDFLSQCSRILHFGLADAEEVERLEVVWPDGTERRFEAVDVNQRLSVSPAGIED